MKVLLHNKELWHKFSEHQTEMMITKLGRRMCPVMSVAFEDLEPLQFYTVMIDFALADEYRYSFDVNSNSWVPYRREAVLEDTSRFYVHPGTPIMGASLMQNVLNFKMVKLTNSPKTAAKSAQAILLNTMRRYIPRIHVIESASGIYFDYKLRKEFYFAETEFMAVTQYRNKQIARLKIDANPFAKAYRSDGLHGQAKRRRMESMATDEDWTAPGSSSPSNSSSLEDSLLNDEELDTEDYSSSSELVHEPPSKESFAPNHRQVNEIPQDSPCQTELRQDASYAHYVIQGETHNQESLPVVSQFGQNQFTNQTNERESHLTCQESAEWMWGFDEQMSMRYPSENQLEGFVKQRDSSTNASRNATDASEVARDACKATVNRRKKYLPRKLPQRTKTVSSKDASLGFEDNADATNTTEAATEIPIVDKVDVPSSQPNDTTISKCGESNEETAQSLSLGTTESPASPCFEPPEKRPVISCNNVPQQQTIIDHTTAILDKFLSPARLNSLNRSSNSLKTSVTPANCPLLNLGSAGTAVSSLNALMQMCSEAEGRLTKQRPLQKQKKVASERFEGILARKNSPSGESEQSDGLGGDPLFERPAKTSTTSYRQLPQENDCNVTASLTSEGEQRTRSSPIPTSSLSNGHVTSSDITATSPVVSSCVSSNNCSSSSSNDANKSPTTVNRFQTGSSAVTIADTVENPLPVIVNTFSGYHVVNGDNSGQPVENKQHGYRHIVPAPNQSVNICSDEPTSDPSDTSSSCSNSIPYPIIVDSFSINEDFRTAVAHRSFKYKILESAQQTRLSNSHFVTSQMSPPPQVNLGYFSSPNAYQTSHSGFIALDNTVHMQPFSLEKLYSFSTPENQVRVARFRHQNRYYKTTRTNFSRLSLEPICSLVYPLYGSN